MIERLIVVDLNVASFVLLYNMRGLIAVALCVCVCVCVCRCSLLAAEKE